MAIPVFAVLLPKDIPFEIVVDGKMKEFTVARETSWKNFLWEIADVTFQHPASLRLGYVNPFRPKQTGKVIPNSLENEQEWDSLLGHIRTYHKEQQAKNKGKGGVIKQYVFTLVNLDGGNPQACISNISCLVHFSCFTGQNATKLKQTAAAINSPVADSVGAQQVKMIKTLTERWQCNQHARLCIVDPGPPPPPIHKNLTMANLHLWATMVVRSPSINVAASDWVR